MRWVKDTLPPRARARWLLMTMRLSQSSLTGTERTEVAVGTVSEASMFCTVRAGAPRSTVYVGSSLAAAGAAGAGLLGHRAAGARGPARRRRWPGGAGPPGWAWPVAEPLPALPGRLPGARDRARASGVAAGAGAGACGRSAGAAGLPLPAAGGGAGVGRRSRSAHSVGTLPGSARELVVHLVDEPLVGAEAGRRGPGQNPGLAGQGTAARPGSPLPIRTRVGGLGRQG